MAVGVRPATPLARGPRVGYRDAHVGVALGEAPMLDQDRVAIVTGAGRGLGSAVAEELARVGVRVVLDEYAATKSPPVHVGPGGGHGLGPTSAHRAAGHAGEAIEAVGVGAIGFVINVKA